MSKIVSLHTQAGIEDEAAAWVWRLDSETVSDDDRQAFADWLRRDPRHQSAFDELGGVWRALDVLAEAKSGQPLVADLRRPPKLASMNRYASAAVAAVLVLSVAAVAWLSMPWSDAITTAVGEQRTVTLADGSVVTLNTNTVLHSQFTRDRRDVRLAQGEAYFEVAKDPARPFLVHVGGSVVRAVGTEFTVWLRETRDIQVVVAEGRVRVLVQPTPDRSGQPADATPRLPPVFQDLRAGQRLALSEGVPSIAPINDEGLDKLLAWREGAVVFEGERLSRAIEVLGRYTDVRFIVSDPRVADLRIGGRFQTNDVDAFLRALSSALPVSIRKDGDFVYIDLRA